LGCYTANKDHCYTFARSFWFFPPLLYKIPAKSTNVNLAIALARFPIFARAVPICPPISQPFHQHINGFCNDTQAQLIQISETAAIIEPPSIKRRVKEYPGGKADTPDHRSKPNAAVKEKKKEEK
jgi:hypothetical protein